MNELIHYCNGQFCKSKKISVHPHDLGFLRAYGVFDFAPVYQGIPFRLNEHLSRLLDCASQVGIDCPFSRLELEEITLKLLDQNPELTGGLRFILTGGCYRTDTLVSEEKGELLILSEPAPIKTSDGIRVTTTNVMRALPHVKTTNYLPAVLGMKKARSMGFADALYVNASGELLEGMTSNLFFVKGGKLYTDDSNQIIKGVTRAVVLEIAREFIEVELKPITLSELSSCEEAFLTSSTKDLLPIVQIDDQLIGKGIEGLWTKSLRDSFLSFRKEEIMQSELIPFAENNFAFEHVKAAGLRRSQL